MNTQKDEHNQSLDEDTNKPTKTDPSKKWDIFWKILVILFILATVIFVSFFIFCTVQLGKL